MFVPILAFDGQNWFPETPGPENVPPVGVPVSVTQGSVEQNGPRAVIVGITCKINTLSVTGVDWHPEAFDAVTVIPLLIKPGDAEDQLTFIVLVPCPETKTPGEATVQVYVYPAPSDGTV